MSEPLLEVADLTLARGSVRVLDIPCWSLLPGTVTALIGPNGSGKSTLLQVLAGLLPPQEGSLRFHGQALTTQAEYQAYRRHVTLVFQEPLLFDATVRSNLASGLKLHGVSGQEREHRITEVADLFGIRHLLDRSARKLSGGEAQRTSLARALALRPEVLLLDEPFSALDPPTRESLIEDLAGILKRTRTTTVMATHDQEEALRLAARMAVLHEGRIVQCGEVAEVINHPADAFVAGFVGMETLLDGPVTASVDGLFTTHIGSREVEALGQEAPGTHVRLGVRPEHVTLLPPGNLSSSARNHFSGTVLRIIPKGPYAKVELDCGFYLAAFVTLRSLDDLELREGSAVVASFKATSVHVIRN